MSTVARLWSPRGFDSSKPRFWLDSGKQIMLRLKRSNKIVVISIDFPADFSEERPTLAVTLIASGQNKKAPIPIGYHFAVTVGEEEFILKLFAVSGEKFLVQFPESTAGYESAVKLSR